MTTRIAQLDAPHLLEATRQALVTVSDGLDVAGVQLETPLATLVFDSLMAVKFVASLEAVLGVEELPFERWLAEHSERTDALTVGSLVDWLSSIDAISGAASPVRSDAHRGPSGIA